MGNVREHGASPQPPVPRDCVLGLFRSPQPRERLSSLGLPQLFSISSGTVEVGPSEEGALGRREVQGSADRGRAREGRDVRLVGEGELGTDLGEEGGGEEVQDEVEDHQAAVIVVVVRGIVW